MIVLKGEFALVCHRMYMFSHRIVSSKDPTRVKFHECGKHFGAYLLPAH